MSRVRRVLMTADTLGGVFAHAVDLARGLALLGVEVGLATLGQRLEPAQRRSLDAIPNLSLFESEYRLEWMDDPWEDVARAGEWLLSLEERFEPDVVHLNGYALGRLPFWAPRLVAAHSSVLGWWRAVRGEAAPPRYDRYRREVRRGLLHADAVVAPSRAMLDSLLAEHGPVAGARVVHNGVWLESHPPSAKRPIILAAGRLWDPGKDLARLAFVAPDLPWPVRIAGASSMTRDAVERGGFAVELLGALPRADLAQRMGSAAIFVHPARYEPFGLAALEAASAGCALVLSDIPSHREIWGPAARYFPPGSTDGLRRALRQLIEDAKLRSALAAMAEGRARRFHARDMARGYLRLYREIVPRRAGGPSRPRDDGKKGVVP